MLDITRRLAAVVLALTLAAASDSAAQSAPSLAELAARRSTTPARHLVWRVAKEGRMVAYLVGSVHVLTEYSYPLPPLFGQVYAETKVLLEEVDMAEADDPTAAVGLAMRAMLPDGQTLSSLLDSATAARVAEKAKGAGVPMMALDRMKPWLVAMTLMVPELQRAGFDPARGLDKHFYDKAKADKRPVKGLETVVDQLDRMNGLSMPVQVEMLKTYLDDAEAQVAALEAIVRSWRTGDVETLERVLLKELKESPEVYERMLVERNRNWIPAISACEAAAPCLVVVGGAHLLGPDSVVALLAKAGFSVEQQ